MNIAI